MNIPEYTAVKLATIQQALSKQVNYMRIYFRSNQIILLDTYFLTPKTPRIAQEK